MDYEIINAKQNSFIQICKFSKFKTYSSGCFLINLNLLLWNSQFRHEVVSGAYLLTSLSHLILQFLSGNSRLLHSFSVQMLLFPLQNRYLWTKSDPNGLIDLTRLTQQFFIEIHIAIKNILILIFGGNPSTPSIDPLLTNNFL